MAHPLEQKIGQVRRRAWMLLALYAASWTIAIVLGMVLVLGLADYLIRFEDRGIRLMCSLAALSAFVWACYRFWFLGLVEARLGDVQLARRIERRFPSLTDRLASTIQFLRQPEHDPQAGSIALRRAVILQTSSEIERLDVSQVFEPAPARRAMVVAGLALLVTGVLVAMSPSSARIALARLARPFGDDAWPRYYRVEFRSPPTRLASGKNFEVELLHGGEHRVPDEVRIHYRYETGDGRFEEETEPMRWINGVMVAGKENVTRPFRYRAEGGDDTSMPWIHLEVLEAPRLESLQISVYPPRYTGLPSEASDKSIHALRGTRVELSGTVTKKLRRATLCLEHGSEIPIELSADGYALSLGAQADPGFVVDKTGQYWIELEDAAGLVGGADDRFEVRAIPDLEPTVTIEEPGTNVFVTPQGEVPLRIAVKDDLAIRDVALHFDRSDRTDVESFAVPLYRGPNQAPRRTDAGLVLAGKLGESRIIEHRWLMSELGLENGTHVTFWATAGDYQPQSGKSTVRRITVISPAELEERLAQRQRLVLAELQRVLKMQQDARSQTRSLEIQLDRVGRFAKPEVDHAQAAELNQRQVTRTLTSPTEGIPSQIADFLAELRGNRVDSPEAERHMTAILDEIERLQREHLGAIESDLTGFIKAAQAKLADAAKSADGSAASGKELNESLTGAGEHQDQVIDALETMLGELGRWDNYRRFARDVAQLQRDQEEIARQTKELAPKMLGRDLKDLGNQQQADLKKLAGEQIELSRRLEKIQQQMAEMGRSLADTDPIATATISDGLHHAQQQAISGQMRRTSEQLERNQLGQASEQQAGIAKDLEDLLSILSNRREQELSRLVKQLREAEEALAQLRSRQAGLRKKMQEAAKIADSDQRRRELERLARQQKQLEDETARMARRLERLQAEQAGRSTASAAGRMASAGQQGGQGDTGAAEQSTAAAEKDLEEAQQKLAERRRQAEADLAQEQLARLEDTLKGLHERQQKLNQETARLENLRAAAGRLTRAQLSTAGDLARQQEGLRGETSQLAEKLELTEVIHLALDGATKLMVRAAELLEHRQTGLETQSAQESARLRLAQLLTALENKQQQGDQEDGGGSDGGGGSNARSDGNFVLAQLKLLKLMQEDLNSRYRTLVSSRDQDSRGLQRQLADLAEEQGKLAELTLNLSEPSVENPEDDPESLPDIRLDDVPPADALPELQLEPTAEEPF